MEGKIITTSDVRQQLAAHLTRLWRYGLVLSRDRDLAEELVQSTCVRALERGAQYTPGTRIDRWLFSILHSIWISELRSRHVRMGKGFVASEELIAPDYREQDDARLHYQTIMRRVNALPEAQRNTVFLVYVEGFTYQEAAQTLAVPVGTIMSRLAAARATLAKPAEAQSPEREKRS
ncbi:RNA polymerase sigma factor [Citrobacter sp. Awk 4]|uniref:RNA polymerase sigma factor n=1 Tax=Citrobacter sp. Awk 4 TaxID=2963955 RepID=UPI002304917F|nr:RNA polymerase sigma factor [Citrobacter sp. Awk 4]MDA8479978.1 RNA polymerase sigma factor [Citrobacter sp. Awk 4]